MAESTVVGREGLLECLQDVVRDLGASSSEILSLSKIFMPADFWGCVGAGPGFLILLMMSCAVKMPFASLSSLRRDLLWFKMLSPSGWHAEQLALNKASPVSSAAEAPLEELHL